MKMVEFETIDIDGVVNKFQYSFEKGDELNPDEVVFKVYSIPSNKLRWFSFRLKIIDDTFAKSELLDNNDNEEFKRKGIPEKIIEIASKTLQRNIISSPISYSPGNYLVPSAKKIWERLVNSSPNTFNSQEQDCFVFSLE